MKTLYLTRGCNIIVDDENKSCGKLNRGVVGIDDVYLAKEPMHVIYGYGDKTEELDAEEGDIIIVFYTDKFSKKVVVVKNDDWCNNLKEFARLEQEEKLRWAKQAETAKCKCDCECVPE